MKEHALVLVAYLLGILQSCSAQEVQVACSTVSGASECADSEVFNISYSLCCTLSGAEERFYRDETGECRRCGPVIDESLTFPSFFFLDTLAFSWELTSFSIPPTTFSVSSTVEGSDMMVFSTPVEGSARNTTFLAQEVGVTYIYQIQAFSADGGVSPIISVQWTFGDSLVPTISAIRLVSANTSRLLVEFELEASGTSPVSAITLEWHLALEDEISGSKVLTFDDTTPEDGTQFNCTLEGLEPGEKYVLKITASNLVGNASFFFVLDTAAASIEPITPEGLNSAALLNFSLMLCPLSVLVLSCLTNLY